MSLKESTIVDIIKINRIENVPHLEKHKYGKTIVSSKLRDTSASIDVEIECRYTDIWHLFLDEQNEFIIEDNLPSIDYTRTENSGLKISVIKIDNLTAKLDYSILLYFWGHIYSKENDSKKIIILQNNNENAAGYEPKRQVYFKEYMLNNISNGKDFKPNVNKIYKLITLIAVAIETGDYTFFNDSYDNFIYKSTIYLEGKKLQVVFKVIPGPKQFFSIDYIEELD